MLCPPLLLAVVFSWHEWTVLSTLKHFFRSDFWHQQQETCSSTCDRQSTPWRCRPPSDCRAQPHPSQRSETVVLRLRSCQVSPPPMNPTPTVRHNLQSRLQYLAMLVSSMSVLKMLSTCSTFFVLFLSLKLLMRAAYADFFCLRCSPQSHLQTTWSTLRDLSVLVVAEPFSLARAL